MGLVSLSAALVMVSLLKSLVERQIKDLGQEAILRFALLFRGLVICVMSEDEPQATLEIMREGVQIIQLCDHVRSFFPLLVMI